MAWQEQLHPASFRGVPFHVDRSENTTGRRTQTHEYPYRDTPWVDDLGRVGREYTVEAFLLGDAVAQQRARLLTALEAAGPGTLVHPRLGALNVQVGSVRWRTSTRNGNVERYSITFLEAGDRREPHADTNTAGLVSSRADTTITAAQTAFTGGFSLHGLPGFVADAAHAVVGTGLAKLRDLASIATGPAQAIADVRFAVDRTIGSLGGLLNQPGELGRQVTGLMGDVFGLDGRLGRVLDTWRSIARFGKDLDPVPTTTVTRQQQANNQTAIASLFTTTATAEAARYVAQASAAVAVDSDADSPFESADQATAVRDALVGALDDTALTADDTLYPAIVALQSALVSHIAAHGNSLPHVETAAFRDTLPALVIAHRLYGDATRADDVVARNRIRNPLFVPAGKALEVLRG